MSKVPVTKKIFTCIKCKKKINFLNLNAVNNEKKKTFDFYCDRCFKEIK